MKKILLLFTILSVSVITSACINNLAVQELNNKAESYMDKGDTEAAICRLKASLDLDDQMFQTHYNLAVAYNSVGNYDGAVNEANKVLELKPDFKDAMYIMAVAKESIAYQVIEQVEDANELSLDEIADFNNKASDAVDAYNKYLVSNPSSSETDQINNKITELNNKIKEYTDLYDNKSLEHDEQIQEDINGEEENQEQQDSDSSDEQNNVEESD